MYFDSSQIVATVLLLFFFLIYVMPNIIGKIGVKKREYTGHVVGKVVLCQIRASAGNQRRSYKIIIEYIVGDRPYRYVIDCIRYKIKEGTEVEMIYDESAPVYSKVFKIYSKNAVFNKICDIDINVPGGQILLLIANIILSGVIVWLIFFLCYNLSS